MLSSEPLTGVLRKSAIHSCSEVSCWIVARVLQLKHLLSMGNSREGQLRICDQMQEFQTVCAGSRYRI